MILAATDRGKHQRCELVQEQPGQNPGVDRRLPAPQQVRCGAGRVVYARYRERGRRMSSGIAGRSASLDESVATRTWGTACARGLNRSPREYHAFMKKITGRPVNAVREKPKVPAKVPLDSEIPRLGYHFDVEVPSERPVVITRRILFFMETSASGTPKYRLANRVLM